MRSDFREPACSCEAYRTTPFFSLFSCQLLVFYDPLCEQTSEPATYNDIGLSPLCGQVHCMNSGICSSEHCASICENLPNFVSHKCVVCGGDHNASCFDLAYQPICSQASSPHHCHLNLARAGPENELVHPKQDLGKNSIYPFIKIMFVPPVLKIFLSQETWIITCNVRIPNLRLPLNKTSAD